MKAKIEFNLPEEHREFSIYNNAMDMYSSLIEVSNILRKYHKYGDTDFNSPLTDRERELIEKIKDEIHEEIWEFIDE